MLLERFHLGPKSILRLWGGGTSLGGKFEGPHSVLVNFHSSSKASVLAVTPYVYLSYAEHA